MNINLQRAKFELQNGRYEAGINWALLAWQQHPDRYTAYLLALGYFDWGFSNQKVLEYLNEINDPKFKNDPPLNENQLSQIAYMKNKVQQPVDAPSVVGATTTRTSTTTISISGGSGALSLKNGTKDVDLQRAQLEQDRLQPLQVPDRPTVLSVTWMDTIFIQHKHQPDEIKTQPHTITYNAVLSQYLLDNRPFLVAKVARLLYDKQNGKWVSDDSFVVEFGITQKNIDAFCNDIFPEVFQERNALKAYLEKVELTGSTNGN